MSENKIFYLTGGTRVIIDTENRILLFEPVEEIVKKPIYTNSYGTEFFEGDEWWCVSKESGEFWNCSKTTDSEYFVESDIDSELLTERECHLYIYMHWNELKTK